MTLSFICVAFPGLDLVQQTLRRVSELDRLPPPLSRLKFWKALDYLVFVLAQSALLTWDMADRTDDPDEKEETERVQEILIHLSNAVYFLSYGHPSDETRKTARTNVEQFADKLMACDSFGASEAVHKFHMFQHFPDFAECHGSAFLWDSFNLEKILGYVGKGVTARVEQGAQVVTNFLLRFHCEDLNGNVSHSSEFNEYVERLGLRRTFFLEKTCLALKYESSDIAPENMAAFAAFLRNRSVGEASGMRGVSRLRVRNFVITSSKFAHRGNVDDSFVQLNGTDFGQIEQMCEVDVSGQKQYLLLLNFFKKEILLFETGEVRHFPENQFPACRTNRSSVYAITKRLFVQKILRSSPFVYNDCDYDFLSIWPNEWYPS